MRAGGAIAVLDLDILKAEYGDHLLDLSTPEGWLQEGLRPGSHEDFLACRSAERLVDAPEVRLRVRLQNGACVGIHPPTGERVSARSNTQGQASG